MALAGIYFVTNWSVLQRARLFADRWNAMILHGDTRRSSDRHEWDKLASEALELARRLPPGPERNDALKVASQLRCSADALGIVFAKRGRPRK
jgi:hypothetical protein